MSEPQLPEFAAEIAQPLGAPPAARTLSQIPHQLTPCPVHASRMLALCRAGRVTHRLPPALPLLFERPCHM